MGTSSPYGGPGNGTPLVPTWLDPDVPVLPIVPGSGIPDGDIPDGEESPIPPLTPETQPTTEPLTNPNRFSTARSNLTQFASSGGSNSGKLGRAISQYVSRSSGGAQNSARKMGSSRRSGGRLLSFLSDAITQGLDKALEVIHFESLVGHSIRDVFLGMIDYICPDGGNIDEGIARDAFVETIVDLADNGIADLDDLNSSQIETIFILYITHTIENRIFNDIGTKAIQLPPDASMVKGIQNQLRDFICRGVTDAVTATRDAIRTLTKDNIHKLVENIYESSFTILQYLGEMEASAI
jgi:hypothetical protein